METVAVPTATFTAVPEVMGKLHRTGRVWVSGPGSQVGYGGLSTDPVTIVGLVAGWMVKVR